MSSQKAGQLSADGGFSLIELLFVVAIIGILLAIAVPSYLGTRDRGAQKAADANIRSALPSVEAYRSDNGNYTNMTAPNLRSAYDAALSPTVSITVSGSAPNETYCVSANVKNMNASFKGPGQSSPWYASSGCTGSALSSAP